MKRVCYNSVYSKRSVKEIKKMTVFNPGILNLLEEPVCVMIPCGVVGEVEVETITSEIETDSDE